MVSSTDQNVMNDQLLLDLRERSKVSLHMTTIHFSIFLQFYMKQKSWVLALECLEKILVEPGDDDEVWRPDTESLLLRSRVRMMLGDKTGALEDAEYVTKVRIMVELKL